MSWETKISRTVRVVNSQEMGTFGRLLTAIANAGGNIGGIELLNEVLLTMIGPLRPFRTIRMIRSSGPCAHSDPASGGYAPGSPRPVV